MHSSIEITAEWIIAIANSNVKRMIRSYCKLSDTICAHNIIHIFLCILAASKHNTIVLIKMISTISL